MRTPKPFLTAEWRWLVMLNYPVEPELLSRGGEPEVLRAAEGSEIVVRRGVRVI